MQAQHGYEGLLASAADEPLPEAVAVRPEDPVFMLYTSGTTGLPKGVVFSQEAMVNRAQADVEGMRFSRDDIMLFVLPFYHVTCVSVFAVLLVGAQMVIGQSNKAPDIVSYVNRYGVTRVGLVPYHMRTLAAYVEAEHVTVDTLKLVIYGAEPAGPALLSRCRALLECDFLQGYGMTETASSVTVLLPEHHKDPRLLETAGVPLPGVEIRIVDEEGRVCPPGTSGEVVVKTNTLMLGYWNDLDQTARVVKDGWYYTEDIGFVDEDGFLTLVDRKNNLVITGGENVYPLEVSRCIASLGACIADVAVTGVPDERWGESLVAFVVRAPGAAVTEEDIVAHCADELGHYKKPKRVVFVDDLQRKSSARCPKSAWTNSWRHTLQERTTMADFDAVVVGAGCAGSVAAYQLASAGKSVLLIERGADAGAKNMTGGRIYTHSLEAVFPDFAEEAPLERKITTERISFITEDENTTMEFASPRLGRPENASYSVLRGPFDRWLASKAEQAGGGMHLRHCR